MGIPTSCRKLGRRANQYLKQLTKQVTATLVTGALSDITRTRADLLVYHPRCRLHWRINQVPYLARRDNDGFTFTAY